MRQWMGRVDTTGEAVDARRPGRLGRAALALALCAAGVWAAAPVTGAEPASGNATPSATGDAAIVPVPDPVVRVAIYGNGLAQIHRRLTVPGIGLYELREIPQPVEGSLWIDSTAQIDVFSGVNQPGAPLGTRPSERDNPLAFLLAALRGKQVVITRRTNDNNGTYLSGVLQDCREGFLLVKTQRGVVFLARDEVIAIDSVDLNAVAEAGTAKPYMRLNVRGVDSKSRIDVRLSYIGGGLLWRPAYSVALLGGDQLRIEAQATIRNELEDLKDVECDLITGAPNLANDRLPALLTPGLMAEEYLKTSANPNAPVLVSLRDLSRTLTYCTPKEGTSWGDDDDDNIQTVYQQGTDLSVKSIGRLNLKKDETFCTPLEFANAAYETGVEWDLSSVFSSRHRDGDGGMRSGSGELWNVLTFKNPFLFPLAEGPVLITQEKQPAMQCWIGYARPDELCSLHLSRAQSLRAEAMESELVEKRVSLAPAGLKDASGQPVRCFFRGELSVQNQRTSAVKLRIRLVVRGEVGETEGAPQRQSLPGDGASPTTELIWTLPLEPNASQRIVYQYTAVRVP